VIDFRYHLVSIVAVFLALAIGIVVGATQLQSATVSTLDNQSKTEQQSISSERTQIRSLQNQLGSAQRFAGASAPTLLAGRLSDQRVVLVTAPGADSAIVTGVSTALAQAGAKVTGQVALQPAFFVTSTKNESSLQGLAQRLAPPGFVPVNATAQLSSDANIAAQNQAAQVIAAALVTTASPAAAGQPAQDSSDLPAAQVQQIVNGFAQQGFLQVTPASSATPLEQATLAVVVIPSSPPSAGDTDPDNLGLISLAYQLRVQSHGVVVAGPLTGSGAGSAIDELINGNTGVQLSSVDDADAEQGQISVAEALSGLLAGQRPQAYGVGTGVVPAPGPDPTTTPTPTPSKTPAKSKSGG
jgi:hypothetical protein